MKRCPDRSHQAGVGLVEIMIAMLIGLFLIGGVAQIFLSNKQSFRVQEAQSRAQENVRLVSVLLSSSMGKAGFRQNPQDDPSVLFPAAAPALSGTNDGGAGTPAGTLANTDTITIRFQGDGIMTGCLGADVPAGVVSTNRYRVRDDGVLTCSVNSGSFQPLLDNVENMQILYGEDTGSDRSVDRYVNAGQVLNFDNVLSVHLALVLASDGDVKPAAESKAYDLVGTSITMPSAGTDRIQRRVVERVIALRNRLR